MARDRTRPGARPFEQLAAALGRVASNDLPDVVGTLTSQSRPLRAVVDEVVPGHRGVLIVVDQLEELFTQTIDDAERRAFLQMVVDVAQAPDSSVRLVATLRADYFDRPLAYPGFDEAIRGRTVALGAMSSDELADAVQLPASAVGVQVEAGVVDRIVAEAELQPGGLPLVQHTLSELFGRRTTNTITVADLDEVGGVAGAIGRRAEQIYQSFDDRCRTAVEPLFLRLVSVTEEHGDTRRRVRRTELEQAGIAPDQLDAVLAEYGRHRLLTFDRDPASRTPTVELAHEALLTEWERFAGWIDEAREDLLTRRRVESAAHDWINAGTDASFLYSGGRLELAEAWAAPRASSRATTPVGSWLRAGKADRDRARVRVGVAGSRPYLQRPQSWRRCWLRSRSCNGATPRSGGRNGDPGTRRAGDARHRRRPGARDPAGPGGVERTDEPSAEVLSALHRATQSMRLGSRIRGVMLLGSMDQSPDGSLLAVDRLDRTGFMLIEAASGKTVADVTTDYQIADLCARVRSDRLHLGRGLPRPEDESAPPSSSSTSLQVDRSIR